MKPDLEQRIDQWQRDAVYNTRQVKIVKELSNGEYILLIIEGAQFNLEERTTTVSVQKLLCTRAQSTDSINSNGDLHAFDMLADIVARTYLEKVSETIGQWLEANFGV